MTGVAGGFRSEIDATLPNLWFFRCELRSEIDDTLPVSGLFRCELRGRGFRSEIGATLPVSWLFRSRTVAGFDQETGDTLPNLGLFGAVRLRVRTGVAYRWRQVAGKTLRK